MITVVSAIARRSRPSASSRSRPYAMIFAIIESKSAGMVSPSLTPVSTRMPGPAGSTSRAIRPGDGREVAVGVLGVEPGLDGVPGLGRLLAVQPAAAGHVQLQPDQVDAGGDLGDRVLDLQPGVDLEEREQPVAGVVEELDGAGAAVADRERRAARPTPSARRSAPAPSTGEADSSMIFWLRRCTEQSRTPSAHAVPWPSAITWTSTCRAPVTRRSRNTTPLPKARSASWLVRS